MKKIYLYLSIILFFGVALNSCISEKIAENVDVSDPGNTGPGNTDNDPSDRKIYFIRFVPEPMSGDSPYATSWSAYRSVGLFLDEENGHSYPNRRFDIATTSGSGSVLFTDTINSSKVRGTSYAYAPYRSFSGEILPGSLNDVQNQPINADGSMTEALRGNMLLVAEPSTFVLNEGTCQLHLKNVFSLIRLKITKDQSLGMAGRMVESVRLYIADKNNKTVPINSKPLAGSYNINIKSRNAVPQFTSPLYSITAAINSSTSAEINNSPVVWLVVNPFTLDSNEELVARIETNGGDVFYSSFELNTAPNYVYDITAMASNDNTHVGIVDMQYFHTSSNSYIISKKGKFVFPVNETVKELQISDGHVDWLWASKMDGGKFDISELIDTTYMIYNGASANPNIMFQVGDRNPHSPLQKGNVILALRDNVSNKIVWTWHIWITDKSDDIVYGNGKPFLDRNIGALSRNFDRTGINNYGFVYQWGRKDPFFGGNGLLNEASGSLFSIADQNTIVNEKAWASDICRWDKIYTTSGTIGMATEYPMRFISNNNISLPENVPADWLSPSNQSLWSDGSKTENDPCPVGYKVPSREDLSSLREAYELGASTEEPVSYFKYINSRYWEYSNESGVTTPWPVAGMRQGRLSLRGNDAGVHLVLSGTPNSNGDCYYWTSTPADIAQPGGSYRIKTSGFEMYSTDDFGDNSDAYPIRCVKE